MTIERAIEILDPEHREHYDSIETVNEACRMGMNALKELSELKEKIKSGLLVELPCKVGTIVYRVIYSDFACGSFKKGYNIHETKFTLSIFEDMLENKFPYTFLTKAEAEARLKELQANKQEAKNGTR